MCIKRIYFAVTEIQLNHVRSLDQSATGYFINNTSTATSWTGNINVRCFGCRGNGINFGYSANYPISIYMKLQNVILLIS